MKTLVGAAVLIGIVWALSGLFGRAEVDEDLVAQVVARSDDGDRHAAAFARAATELLATRSCSPEDDFIANGGFVRSTFRPGLYFIDCRDYTLRAWVDPVRGSIDLENRR